MSETQINFPSNPSEQTPENTFSPVSVPESSKNGITYVYDNGVWSSISGDLNGGGGGGEDNASIITSDTPPTAPPPEDGDLWWNTSSNTLYIYYVDEDTSQWVVTTPQNNIANEPDLEEVTYKGNNTTIGITIGPEEGPPLTTLSDDGSATFEGTVTAEGFVVSGGSGGGEGGEGDLLVTGDLTVLGTSQLSGDLSADGNITAVGFIQADNSITSERTGGSSYCLRTRESSSGELGFVARADGTVLIGGDVTGGSPNIYLNADGSIAADGSAEFTQGITINGSGVAPKAITAYSGTDATGTHATIFARNSAAGNTGRVFFGTYDGGNPTSEIFSNGTAVFGGAVNVGGQVYSGLNTNTGLLRANRSGDEDNNALVIDGASGRTVEIKGNGSASFANNAFVISSDANVYVNGDAYGGAEVGARIFPTGTYAVTGDTTTTQPIFLGYKQGVSAANVTINSDGSAEFKGDLIVTDGTSRSSISKAGATSFIRNSVGAVSVNGFSTDGAFGLAVTNDPAIDDSDDYTAYIYNDGSAVFDGTITNGTFDSSNSSSGGNAITNGGGVYSQVPTSGRPHFTGYLGTDTKVSINGDGSAYFDSFVGIGAANPEQLLHTYGNNTTTGYLSPGLTVEQNGTGDVVINLLLSAIARYIIGIDNSDSDKLKILSDDNGDFSGKGLEIDRNGNLEATAAISCPYIYNTTTTAPVNVVVDGNGTLLRSTTSALTVDDAVMRLDPDNAANFNSEGEYTGPTLDVKDRLQKADNALQALKTAAASASDFAALKAAIVTALADI